MGHALAHDLVEGEESAVATKRGPLCCGHPPASVKERPEQPGGHFGQGGVVLLGHDKGVPVEDWPVVQERDELWLV